MNKLEKDLAEAVQRIRELLMLESSDTFQLSCWQEQAENVSRFIKSRPELSDNIDEEVWHYLADIDVRSRDQKYASRQNNYLLRYLEKVDHKLQYSSTE